MIVFFSHWVVTQRFCFAWWVESLPSCERNLEFAVASFVCRDLVLLPLVNSNKIVICLYFSRGSSNVVHSKTAEEKQRRFQQARVRHARGSVPGSAPAHLYCKYFTTDLQLLSFRYFKSCHGNHTPTGCILLLDNVLSDTAGLWIPWMLAVYLYVRGIKQLPRVEKDRLSAWLFLSELKTLHSPPRIALDW